MNNKELYAPIGLLITLLLSGCQTGMDKQYHYIEPIKEKSVICYSQEDSILLSKRAYTDNNKTSKQLALFPKIRNQSCKVVKNFEIITVDYSPKVEFRLSEEGLDSYYSPIHQLDKVRYKDELYWLVR